MSVSTRTAHWLVSQLCEVEGTAQRLRCFGRRALSWRGGRMHTRLSTPPWTREGACGSLHLCERQHASAVDMNARGFVLGLALSSRPSRPSRLSEDRDHEPSEQRKPAAKIAIQPPVRDAPMLSRTATQRYHLKSGRVWRGWVKGCSGAHGLGAGLGGVSEGGEGGGAGGNAGWCQQAGVNKQIYGDGDQSRQAQGPKAGYPHLRLTRPESHTAGLHKDSVLVSLSQAPKPPKWDSGSWLSDMIEYRRATTDYGVSE